jgi:FtsP/CotA-like multicopper oxidase with cupredoxin domain
MVAHPVRRHGRPRESDSDAFFKAAALLLGLAVAVVGFFALLMWADARDDGGTASSEAAATPAATHNHATDHVNNPNQALPVSSFAGVVAPNAQELAEAHRAYDATMPPVPAGNLVKVHMTLKDMQVEIAPGVKYNTWAFDGHGAPGPVIHVREGQTVQMTMTNGASIPHSIDFHAARIAPDKAFRDSKPGESFTFRFKASDPGIFMYH